MRSYILIILLLISGCSHTNYCTVKISLAEVQREKHSTKGYHERLYKFIYLLENSIDAMLNDVQRMQFDCKQNQNLTLKISLTPLDLYDNLTQKHSLHKHSIKYTIYYQLLNTNKEVLSGNITTVDSFFTPHNLYADFLSMENSQLSAIANITQQLELELLYFLRNSYK